MGLLEDAESRLWLWILSTWSKWLLAKGQLSMVCHGQSYPRDYCSMHSGVNVDLVSISRVYAWNPRVRHFNLGSVYLSIVEARHGDYLKYQWHLCLGPMVSPHLPGVYISIIEAMLGAYCLGSIYLWSNLARPGLSIPNPNPNGSLHLPGGQYIYSWSYTWGLS